jgi:hypothetical protein
MRYFKIFHGHPSDVECELNKWFETHEVDIIDMRVGERGKVIILAMIKEVN